MRLVGWGFFFGSVGGGGGGGGGENMHYKVKCLPGLVGFVIYLVYPV